MGLLIRALKKLLALLKWGSRKLNNTEQLLTNVPRACYKEEAL